MSPDEFEVNLLAALHDLNAEDTEYIRIDQTLRHRSWNAKRLPPAAETPSNALIDLIEEWNAKYSALFDERLHQSDDQAYNDKFESKLIELEAEEAQAIAPHITPGTAAQLRLSTRGIRFAIDFSHSRSPLNLAQRSDVNRRLTRICETVAEYARVRYGDTGNLSLYSGFGTFSSHLIIGQAPDSHFYGFARKVLEELFTDGLPEAFPGMKTTTNVYAHRYPLLICESLRNTPTHTFTEGDLESSQENESLEFKSSVWLDANLLFTEGKHVRFEGGPDSISKAICGMLNRTGGMIVVGVAESSRVPDSSTRDIVDRFPLTPDRTYTILGIEEEFKNKEVGVSDWDSWMRKAVDAVTKKITPDPKNLLCLTVTPLHLSARYDKRTLGIIVVEPPRDRTTWFYHADQFYVRHAGRTEPLRGAAIDTYRHALGKTTYG